MRYRLWELPNWLEHGGVVPASAHLPLSKRLTTLPASQRAFWWALYHPFSQPNLGAFGFTDVELEVASKDKIA